MNTYGLTHFWSEGDFLIRSVTVLLILMSLISWTVIFYKLWQQSRLHRIAHRVGKEFWRSHSLVQGINLLSGTGSPNPFRILVEEGLHAVEHHAKNREELQGMLNLSEWLISTLRANVDEIADNLQRGLPLLASIASTAPFIGLFGTVWGIYHALLTIGFVGQANIAQIAGPVGEALIMTALGLAVAIPAVLGYNILVRGNRSLLSKLNRFGQDLHAYLLTGSRVKSKVNSGIASQKATFSTTREK